MNALTQLRTLLAAKTTLQLRRQMQLLGAITSRHSRKQ